MLSFPLQRRQAVRLTTVVHPVPGIATARRTHTDPAAAANSGGPYAPALLGRVASSTTTTITDTHARRTHITHRHSSRPRRLAFICRTLPCGTTSTSSSSRQIDTGSLTHRTRLMAQGLDVGYSMRLRATIYITRASDAPGGDGGPPRAHRPHAATHTARVWARRTCREIGDTLYEYVRSTNTIPGLARRS